MLAFPQKEQTFRCSPGAAFALGVRARTCLGGCSVSSFLRLASDFPRERWESVKGSAELDNRVLWKRMHQRGCLRGGHPHVYENCWHAPLRRWWLMSIVFYALLSPRAKWIRLGLLELLDATTATIVS